MARFIAALFKSVLTTAVILLSVFNSQPYARPVFSCDDEKIHNRNLGIRGMKPLLHLVCDFGETYTIFINQESGEWTVTRKLMLESNTCVMAMGQRFKAELEFRNLGN